MEQGESKADTVEMPPIAAAPPAGVVAAEDEPTATTAPLEVSATHDTGVEPILAPTDPVTPETPLDVEPAPIAVATQPVEIEPPAIAVATNPEPEAVATEPAAPELVPTAVAAEPAEPAPTAPAIDAVVAESPAPVDAAPEAVATEPAPELVPTAVAAEPAAPEPLPTAVAAEPAEPVSTAPAPDAVAAESPAPVDAAPEPEPAATEVVVEAADASEARLEAIVQPRTGIAPLEKPDIPDDDRPPAVSGEIALREKQPVHEVLVSRDQDVVVAPDLPAERTLPSVVSPPKPAPAVKPATATNAAATTRARAATQGRPTAAADTPVASPVTPGPSRGAFLLAVIVAIASVIVTVSVVIWARNAVAQARRETEDARRTAAITSPAPAPAPTPAVVPPTTIAPATATTPTTATPPADVVAPPPPATADTATAPPATADTTTAPLAVVATTSPVEDCVVTVTSPVKDAFVWVDGHSRGNPPVSANVPCGKSVGVTVRHDRYVEFRSRVVAKPEGVSVDARLAREQIDLTVVSEPPDVGVWYGTRKLGTTPLKAKIDRYEPAKLWFRAVGYAPDWRMIEPQDTSSSITIKLKRL